MSNEYGLPILIGHVVDPLVVADEMKQKKLSE